MKTILEEDPDSEEHPNPNLRVQKILGRLEVVGVVLLSILALAGWVLVLGTIFKL